MLFRSSLTNGNAAGTNIGSTTAQYAILKITGTTTTKVITAPSSSKTYTVINASSYGVTVKASGQTGVTVSAGTQANVAFNGTDYVLVATNDASKFTGVLPVANGGTNLSSYTTGDIIYASGSTTLSKLGIGTTNYVMTSSGSAPQWTQYLSVAQGGTGSTTLTANNVLLGNGTSALQAVAPGTSGNILTSNGTTWTSAAPTGVSTGKSIAMAMIFGF